MNSKKNHTYFINLDAQYTTDELTNKFRRIFRKATGFHPSLKAEEEDIIQDCWAEFLRRDQNCEIENESHIARVVQTVFKRYQRRLEKSAGLLTNDILESLCVEPPNILFSTYRGQEDPRFSDKKLKEIQKNTRNFQGLKFESLEDVCEYLDFLNPHDRRQFGRINESKLGRYVQCWRNCIVCDRDRPCLSIVEVQRGDKNRFFWRCFRTDVKSLGIKNNLKTLFSIIQTI